MQDDARITNRDLAARVHVSTSTSSEHTRALFAAGVISGYHASIALDALSRHVQALVAITVRPPTRAHIEGAPLSGAGHRHNGQSARPSSCPNLAGGRPRLLTYAVARKRDD